MLTYSSGTALFDLYHLLFHTFQMLSVHTPWRQQWKQKIVRSQCQKLFKQIKDKRKTKKPFLTKDILLIIFFNIKGEKHETNAKTLVFASPRYLHINNSLIWCKYYHWLVLSSRLQRLTQMFASKCQQNLNNCILLQNGR